MADSSQGLTSGDQIGSIKIIRSLGAGGMGAVYEGFDETLRRKVAIKAIAYDHRLSESARSRFLREARLLSQLDHPNICRVYDFIESDAGEFLVLELLKGVDLGTAIDHDIEPRRKLEIARAVASALTAAHGAGIVHRDLKPGNVMLTDSGEVKVLDFGLARTLDDDGSASARSTGNGSHVQPTKPTPGESNSETLLVPEATTRFPEPPVDETAATLLEPKPRPTTAADEVSVRTAFGAVVGTPLFMSPEQARGRAVSTASDMYSFGLLLQTILTGRSPYAKDLSGGEILALARRGETLPVTEGDRDLRQLIESLKSLAPASRPTATTVLSRLDWILEKPKRRRRQITIAGLLIVAALAGIKYTIDLGRERNLAVAARKVAEQRRDQAENLIGFMLGDLREKLEAVGRLQILDDVGEKAMEYFAAVSEVELSDEELLSRSKALYQIGEVRIAQGDLPAAEEPLRQSLALTEELSARDPDDGERLFEVGQSQFWVGYVYWFQGDLQRALEHWRSYFELSERLTEIDPENLDWRLEVGYALTNLGTVYERLGRPEEALAVVERSNAILRDVVAADSSDFERTLALAGGMSWYGSMLLSATRLDDAMGAFREESQVRTRLLESDPSNPTSAYMLATTEERIGELCLKMGDLACALTQLRQAVKRLADIVTLDETNSDWRQELAVARRLLGDALFEAGRFNEAGDQHSIARDTLEALLASDPTNASWRRQLAMSYLGLARLRLTRDGREALSLTRSVLESLESLKHEDNRTQRVLADAHILAGRASEKMALSQEAVRSWEQALDVLGLDSNKRPDLATLDLQVQALLFLGRVDEARAAVEQMKASGYARPGFLAMCRQRGLDPAQPTADQAA